MTMTDGLLQQGDESIDSELNELVERTLKLEHELELVIRLKDMRE